MEIGRYIALATVVTIVTVARTASCQPPLEPIDPAAGDLAVTDVQRSIDLGVGYLKRVQSPDGQWSDISTYRGGVTALCTLALLNCGLPPDDQNVRKALDALRHITPNKTYVVALQTMVFCRADPQRDRVLIRRNVHWLEQAQVPRGPAKGGWSYDVMGGGGDVSNSQFAVLALHEAERVGVSVDDRTWNRAHTYWVTQQLASGAWGYTPSEQTPLGSRTCAGIAALIITSGRISEGAARVVDGQVLCCGKKTENDSLNRGLAWLTQHFSVLRNPGEGQQSYWHYYYLYGLERAGRLTAQRFIGDHDWYREGAEYLIGQQDQLGGLWRGGAYEQDPRISTGLALLFLSKGRRPVVAVKLRYGQTDDWNNHPHDLGNLTIQAERLWHRDLTWQVIDVQAATVEDLLQAPVIYMSGRDSPNLTDAQKQKLRDYLDRGGFLFADACCGGKDFVDGFHQLMKDVFPEPEYRLRKLPPGHPIWHAEERVNPEYLKPLWGIDYGCRTSVVFCPDDLSCYWELSREGRGIDYPKNVQGQVDAALAMGVNVLTYATGREPRYKDLVPDDRQDQRRQPQHDRATIRLAKLRHPGACNAAPGALANLARAAEKALHVPVTSENDPLDITDPTLFRYPFTFMHGRNAFRLTMAERESLRTYLQRGGTLLVDSVCASRAFTESFRREIREIFPDHPLERIPLDHSLFTTAHGGYDITTVTRRDPANDADGQPLRANTRHVPPELEAVELDGRLAVIFSPYDLSCALEKQGSLECQGYVREDAARIALNVLLYALQP